MFLPVAAVFLAGVVPGNAFTSWFMAVRENLNPDQIGIIATFSLLICIGFIVLWLFAADVQSKKSFSDGIKILLGASIGAAVEHRTKNTPRSNSTHTNSGISREP